MKMLLIRRCILITMALLHALCGSVVASNTDTLRANNERTLVGRFTASDQERCIQRFSLPAGSVISSISLLLDGPPSTHACDVVLYGHEGGMIVPRLSSPLYSFSVAKTVQGLEIINVTLDDAYDHKGGQLFLSIENTSKDISLVTDLRQRKNPCTDQRGLMWYDQIIMREDGSWFLAPFGFDVEVVLDRPKREHGMFERDTTVDDANDKQRGPVSYISCNDVNADGKLDFSAAGVLYVNNGKSITPVEIAVDASNDPVYAFFIDVDHDGITELAAMRAVLAEVVELYSYTAKGVLAKHSVLPLPTALTPKTLSIADINADGREDILIGGETRAGPVLVLAQAQPSGRWKVDSILGNVLTDKTNCPLTTFVDIQGDGYLDLLLRNGSTDIVVSNVGRDNLTPTLKILGEYDLNVDCRVSPWITNNPVTQSVIIQSPVRAKWTLLDTWHSVDRVDEHLSIETSVMPRYEENLSSVVFVDIDNDAVNEIVRFSEGACRSLSIFKKATETEWIDVTYEWGLDNLDDCENGIFADLNNDGRIDLIVDRHSKVEVYYNKLAIQPAQTIVLSSIDASTSSAVVAQTNSSPTRTWTLVSGRGYLIQDPPVVHFASNGVQDTLRVQWGGLPRVNESFVLNTRERTHTVQANRGIPSSHHAYATLATRYDGGVIHAVLVADTPLRNVRIEILTIQGELLTTTEVEGFAAGKHDLTFDAPLKSMTTSSGTYVLRCVWHDGQVSSIIQIVR